MYNPAGLRLLVLVFVSLMIPVMGPPCLHSRYIFPSARRIELFAFDQVFKETQESSSEFGKVFNFEPSSL
jgi:hypothetical protein